jgi:NhaA family Na+:H+ antiporter
MYRVSPFVRRFALALLAGIAVATLWVNLAPGSYYDMIEWRLLELSVPAWIAPDPLVITPLAAVSEGLMALFLFFIGKELWEALILERGALRGEKAALPLAAMLGGSLGAVAVWLIGAAIWETALEASPGDGWPVPIGSDVVLAYLVGRLVFGAAHPALHFLLLVTIGSNILGLVVLGLAFPATDLRLFWLLVPALALGLVWFFFGRLADPRLSERAHRRAFALWPYVLAGLASWGGIVLAGLPGALGLLPLIPVIPHADRAFGLFAEAEEFLHDPLNRLAHYLVRPVALILFLFGLTRGGVDFLSVAPTTMTVLAALWIGKPLGLFGAAVLAHGLGRFTLPPRTGLRDIALVALISGIGFTVPVLAIDTALPGGGMAEAARAGLALSLLVGALAYVLARILPR